VRLVAEKLSWEEIKKRYPDEWVALVDDDWPDTLPEPLSGIVYAHSPDHKTLIEMQKPLRDAAILWTGKTQGESLKAALRVDRAV
jgi:hypothetical protein